MTLLLVFLLLAILAVLFTGLVAMARGGEFNRKYGNKLMRLRVIVQLAAVLVIILAMLFSKGG